MANSYAIHAGLWGSTKLPGLTGAAIQTGRQTRFMGNSGSPHIRLASAGRYDQHISLQGRALKTMLGLLGTSGTDPIPESSLISSGPLVLAAAGIDDVLPVYTAGSTHELMTIARGLAQMTSLNWGGIGTGVDVGIDIHPLSADGDASGWSIAAGALPTLATAEEDYDLSAATWNGSALVGMETCRLSMATSAAPMHNPGKLYPTYIRGAPASGTSLITAQFSLPDRSLLRTYGAHFSGGAIANLVLTYAPFAQAAALSASNTVVFTLAGVAQIDDANDGRPGSVNVTVTGVSANGTTSPLTWATP